MTRPRWMDRIFGTSSDRPSTPPLGADPDQLFDDACKAEADGDMQGAVRLYSQVIELRPDDAAALGNRGLCLTQFLGEHEAAEADLKAAVTASGGDLSAATSLIEFYLDADPPQRDPAAALELIDGLLARHDLAPDVILKYECTVRRLEARAASELGDHERAAHAAEIAVVAAEREPWAHDLDAMRALRERVSRV